jgi:hypothetical protein
MRASPNVKGSTTRGPWFSTEPEATEDAIEKSVPQMRNITSHRFGTGWKCAINEIVAGMYLR